jgi:hypothetical protein
LGEDRIRAALIQYCDTKAASNQSRNRHLNIASQLRSGGNLDTENFHEDIDAREVYCATVRSCGLHLTTDGMTSDPYYVSARGGIELHDYNSVRGGKVLTWKSEEELASLCGKQELDKKLEDLDWIEEPTFVVYHDCT